MSKSLLLLLVILPGFLLPAPAMAANRALELDGDGDYVQLPANIFNDLTEATVEGWVQWDKFGSYMRFFDFGREWQAMVVGNFQTTPTLSFELWGPGRQQQAMQVPNILQTGQWCHVSVSTGKKGIQLYFNGQLVGTNAFTGSFASVRNGERNFLGRNNWKEVSNLSEDFKGRIDEVRVWKTERTAEQIRSGMFQKFPGSEPGLLGQWNFDEGTAADSGPGAYHGKMEGDAKAVPITLPGEKELVRPTLLRGTVTGLDGKPLPFARVNLELKGAMVASGNSDNQGQFLLAVYPTNQPYDIVANHAKVTARQKGLQLKPGEEKMVSLSLQPVTGLAGRLISLPGKKPLPSMMVQLVRQAETNLPTTGRNAPRANTSIEDGGLTMANAAGEFRFGELPDGKYALWLHLPGHRMELTNGLSITRSEPLTNLVFEVNYQRVGMTLPAEKSGKPAVTGVTRLASAGEATWIGTTNGLYRRDQSVIRPISVKKEKSAASGNPWPEVPITALASFADGVWVGTSKGLSKVDWKKQEIKNFTTRDGLPHNRINAIWAENETRVWVGTDFGLSLYDGKTFTLPEPLAEKTAESMITVLAGRGSEVWIGTYNQGAWFYDGKTVASYSRTNGLSDNRVAALSVDDSGRAWISGRMNLQRIQGTNLTSYGPQEGFLIPGLEMIEAASDGSLWAASEQGLSQFASNSLAQFPLGGTPGTQSLAVLSRNNQQTLWAGGPQGLYVFNSKYSEGGSASARAYPVTVGPAAVFNLMADPAPAKPVPLQIGWKSGQKEIFRVDVHQEMSFSFPGMPMPQKQFFDMGQIVSITALREREGAPGHELELEIIGVELTVGDGQRNFVDFDSKLENKAEGKDPLVPALKKMTGPKFRLLVGTNGLVEKVEDYQKFVETVTADSQEARGFFHQIFGEDFFKNLVGFQNQVLKQQVREGESWSLSHEIHPWLFGNVQTDSDVAFKGFKDHEGRRLGLIQFAGEVRAKSATGIMGNMTFDPSRTRGKIFFDPATGIVVDSQAEHFLFSKMNQRGGPGGGASEIWQQMRVQRIAQEKP